MKPWLKLVLAVTACGLIWGGFYLDQTLSEKEQTTKKQEIKVADFETKDVLKLTVKTTSGKYVFQRDGATFDWKMSEPAGIRPDQDAINNYLSALQSMTYEQHLLDAQKVADAVKAGKFAEAKDFGFDTQKLYVEVEVAANKDAGTKARTLKVWLGGDVSIGGGAGAAFNALSVYLVSADRTGLLAVASSSVSSLKKELKDFRSRIVGDYKVADVKEFELTKNDGTTISLAKTDDKGQSQWNITQPKKVKADNNQVGLYLDSWVRLRADKVTEREAVNDQNKEALGLARPNAVLTVKAEGGKVIQTIQVGLTKDALYATMSDGSVGSFELSKFPELVPMLKFFRDRRVFFGVSFNDIAKLKTASGRLYQKEDRNWYPVDKAPAADPKKPEKVANEDVRKFVEDWEFATAEDVLDAGETTTPGPIGLEKPITRFTLSAADGEKNKIEILVGNRVHNNEKAVYVKRADTPEVFVMDAKWLDVLTRLDQGGQSPQAKK